MTPAIEGPVVWRGDERYEATRQSMVWNALKPARYPEAIVSAASDADVVAAVRLARSRGLQVAVRAGGHSWVGSPLRDGTLLIDLSSLREVAVDPAAGTAAVQPAVTSSELAQALAADGLAFPVGHCPSVGISGFLLSGGLGWNTGAWGPACLSLQAIDVVTPDGAAPARRRGAEPRAPVGGARRGPRLSRRGHPLPPRAPATPAGDHHQHLRIRTLRARRGGRVGVGGRELAAADGRADRVDRPRSAGRPGRPRGQGADPRRHGLRGLGRAGGRGARAAGGLARP